jgi:hypothetical protein
MSTMTYEAEQRRLRVVGACGSDDVSRIREAVLTHAREGENLIVDLTAVTEVTNEVGRALLAAQHAADRCRVTLVRKCDSPVDSCLRETQRGSSSDLRG